MRIALRHLLPAAGLPIVISQMFSGCGTVATDRAFAALEFPLGNTCDVDRFAAFGIPNWSGAQPHNGRQRVLRSATGRKEVCDASP